MDTQSEYAIEARWIHVAYEEKSQFNETYGLASNQGAVNLEGVMILSKGHKSTTLLIFMHSSP